MSRLDRKLTPWRDPGFRVPACGSQSFTTKSEIHQVRRWRTRSHEYVTDAAGVPGRSNTRPAHALGARGLEVVRDCIDADFEIEESGDAGAWIIKTRELGGTWSECKSAEASRNGAVTDCFGPPG